MAMWFISILHPPDVACGPFPHLRGQCNNGLQPDRIYVIIARLQLTLGRVQPASWCRRKNGIQSGTVCIQDMVWLLESRYWKGGRGVYTRYINALAFAGMVLVNYLSTNLPLGGRTTQEVSDMFPVLFTPAGYVFAIWGVIYALLAGFVVYSFINTRSKGVNRAGYLFAISCVLNGAWLFAWHWLYMGLSLAIMVGLLAILVVIVNRVRAVGGVSSTAEKWLVRIPFSVYLGWISVATIANVSVVLFNAGWSGWGLTPGAWTVILIGAAVVLGALSVLRHHDIAYVLVVVWALTGIGVARNDLSTLEFTAPGLTAWAGALFLILFTVWVTLAERSKSTACGHVRE